MDLYEKIYLILNEKLIPQSRYKDLEELYKTINNTKNKITNMTSQYYIEKLYEYNRLKYSIIDDNIAYEFYLKNKGTNKFDLHGIYGYQVDSILDAIFDYCILKNIISFNLITGSGKIVKPKTLKYLKYFNVRYKIENNGLIEIISY